MFCYNLKDILAQGAQFYCVRCIRGHMHEGGQFSDPSLQTLLITIFYVLQLR